MTPFALNGGNASSEASDGAVAYRIGFVLFIFALLLRIAAIEATGASVVRFGDGLDYLSAARVICEEGSYPQRGSLPFFRAPGLPFFIAAVTACEPSRVRLIKYALAGSDAGTVVLIFLMAQFLWRRVASDPRFSAVPFLAAVLAAFQPLQVAATTDIRTEPLFTFLLTLSMWLLLRRRPILSGVAIALASLVRPSALLCIPLFMLYLLWRPDLTASKRLERAAPALAFLVAAILSLAPWTIRNAVHFGELIVVNDAGGFSSWRGTHSELMETVRTMDAAEFARRSVHFETVTVVEAARAVDARAATPGARNREWKRMAWENVRSDPGFAVRATFEKALMYWRPWLHPAEHGGPAMALSLMVSMTLFIGGAIGMAQYPDRRFVVAVLAFFAAMWLAHLPYIPTIRLRMPLVDPLLTVFTAGALSAATVRLRKDWKAYLPLLLVFLPIVALAIVATQLADMP
ncbi:MAG TPA: glycosyltransferase 87 family protein, partial [Thermoanaerobaculia bacterium]